MGSIPGQEDSLEKEMAIHYSVLTWRIPGIEEPGGLQSMGLQRVRHDLATKPPPGFRQEKESSLGQMFGAQHISPNLLLGPQLLPPPIAWARSRRAQSLRSDERAMCTSKGGEREGTWAIERHPQV